MQVKRSQAPAFSLKSKTRFASIGCHVNSAFNSTAIRCGSSSWCDVSRESDFLYAVAEFVAVLFSPEIYGQTECLPAFTARRCRGTKRLMPLY